MGPWTAYSIVWLSMALVVSTGIKVTGKWSLLWFMLIPACIGIKTKSGGDEKDGSGEKDSGVDG